MKTKTMNQKSQGGFTLLELLIVVAILAIIGGALLSAYNGLTGIAANGVATNTISATSQAIRTHEAVEKSLPDNLETLLAAVPVGATYDADSADNIASSVTDGALTAMLGSKIAGKLGVANLSYGQVKSLVNSGIDSIRYIDSEGDDETTSDLVIKDAAGGDATAVGPLSEISIPTHAFDAPRPGNGRNRGRGFSLDLNAVLDAQAGAADTDASGVFAAVWDMSEADGTTAATNDALDIDEYDNVKVGAQPTAILVALGVGGYSSLVTAPGNVKYLANAPIYGKVKREEYAHYIALIDVSGSTASFVSVIDSRGDFLDEEFAEATGQKQ